MINIKWKNLSPVHWSDVGLWAANTDHIHIRILYIFILIYFHIYIYIYIYMYIYIYLYIAYILNVDQRVVEPH